MANEFLKKKKKNPTARGSFPIPRDFSIEGKRFAQAVQDSLQQLKGEKGNILDRAVTFQDLIDTGIAKQNFSLTSGGSDFVIDDNDKKDGVANPTAPTGFTASGAFQNILLAWDFPTYAGHSHTEIFVSNSNSFASRTFLAQTTASVFSHQVGNAATKYYWVRHVNQNDEAGPFNSETGTSASTAVDVGAVMAELSEEIKLLPGFNTLNTDMSITLSGTQRTLQSTLETINTLAGTAATNVSNLTTNTPRVIRSDSEPTQRPDGTSLQTGDIWIDTDSSPNINELFVYTGSTFAATTAGSTSSSDTTLQTQITSNGTAITQNASDILLVAGVSDRANISTSVNITSLNAAITNSTTGLSANANAISTLSSTVTNQGNTISTLSTNVTELQNTLTGFNSSSTVATAISGLQTQITANDNDVTNINTSITSLTGTVNTKARTFIQDNPPTATAIGDLWIDSNDSNKLYRATATTNSNWVAVGDSSGLHVFAQDNEPTARPDSSTLQEGDIWFDTNDNKKQYRYDGTNFVAVDDTRITTNASAISTLQTNVSNINGTVSSNSSKITALENTVNDTSTGVDATASALSSLTSTVTSIPVNFIQANAPTGSLTTGDLWIDSDDNQLYRYDGNNWVSVRDSVITSNSTAITALQNTVNGAGGVAANASAISTLQTEVFGSGSASASRIDSLESSVTNNASGISTNASAISALTTKVNTKNKSFVGTDAPANDATNDLQTGDLWIETDDNNKLYRWSGSQWVPLAPTGLQTFAQSTTPTATSIGDIWIHTGDQNKIYRWNGSTWQPLRDGLITANASSITAISSELGITFDARVTTNNGTKNIDVQTMASGSSTAHNITNADVTNGVFLSLKGFSSTGGLSAEQLNRTFKVVSRLTSTTLRVEVAGTNANASATSSILTNGATIGTNAGVLQLAETTTNTLGQADASYVLQVNSNGHIAGFVVQSSTSPSGQQTSNVIFQADRFAIVPSSGTGSVTPFIVDGGTVFIDTANIKDGTIQAAKIGSLSADLVNAVAINADSITAGSLGASFIDISGLITAGGLIIGSDLSTDGSTSIHGGNLQTGTISANKLTITPLESGDAAADINANATTIDGGKITANSITVDQINTQNFLLPSAGGLTSGSVIGNFNNNSMRYAFVTSIGSGAGFYTGFVRAVGGTGQVKTIRFLFGDGTHGPSSSNNINTTVTTGGTDTPSLIETSAGVIHITPLLQNMHGNISQSRLTTSADTANIPLAFRYTGSGTVKLFIQAQGDNNNVQVGSIEARFIKFGIDTPDQFTFQDVSGASTNTLHTSNTITLGGQFTSATAVLTGNGSPEMSKNGGTFSSSSVTVSSGDTIQVRLTSASGAGFSRTATVTIAETSDSYSVQTTPSGQNPPGGGGRNP